MRSFTVYFVDQPCSFSLSLYSIYTPYLLATPTPLAPLFHFTALSLFHCLPSSFLVVSSSNTLHCYINNDKTTTHSDMA